MKMKQTIIFLGVVGFVIAGFIYINSISTDVTNVAAYQDSNDDDDDDDDDGTNNSNTDNSNNDDDESEDDVEDVVSDNYNYLDEIMIVPVLEGVEYEIGRSFYDSSTTSEEQVDSIVTYIGSGYTTYITSTGTSYQAVNGEDFSVVSVFSGTVTDIRPNPLLNTVVEIEHANNVTTIYYSLKDVDVTIGDTVSIGDVIGTSSYSTFDSQLSSHVQLELKQDGVYLNPEEYIGKKLLDIN